MVELVDELVDKIELTAQELDEIRDALDAVLIKYEEQIWG